MSLSIVLSSSRSPPPTDQQYSWSSSQHFNEDTYSTPPRNMKGLSGGRPAQLQLTSAASAHTCGLADCERSLDHHLHHGESRSPSYLLSPTESCPLDGHHRRSPRSSIHSECMVMTHFDEDTYSTPPRNMKGLSGGCPAQLQLTSAASAHTCGLADCERSLDHHLHHGESRSPSYLLSPTESCPLDGHHRRSLRSSIHSECMGDLVQQVDPGIQQGDLGLAGGPGSSRETWIQQGDLGPAGGPGTSRATRVQQGDLCPAGDQGVKQGDLGDPAGGPGSSRGTWVQQGDPGVQQGDPGSSRGTRVQQGDPGPAGGPGTIRGTWVQQGDLGPAGGPGPSRGTRDQQGDPGPAGGPGSSRGTRVQQGDPGLAGGPGPAGGPGDPAGRPGSSRGTWIKQGDLGPAGRPGSSRGTWDQQGDQGPAG
ncbi:hypothetical protein NHX12_015416 [Muraenolepis orangiensis]|uniref:Uncharacterized protein n=1 Tax=Muraenolepis orangiensis TaxID=630683 RepID=A0A9Q0D8N3_9TELE|nr:hypothetical protein NHX12_015416 [Muraenolepis orangiensis]